MTCGIVILNYNDFETTRTLVDHIRDFDELDSVVVVDNCSTDDSFNHLMPCEGGKVKVLRSPRNGGYAFGNNIGARYLLEHSDVDLIAIANPDISFENNFVAKIKQLFLENPDYAVITGLQVNSDNEALGWSFWEEETASNLFREKLSSILFTGTNLLLLVAKQIFKRITLLTKKDTEIDYFADMLAKHHSLFQTGGVGGAFFFTRARDFEAVGLFDEKTFLFREENILAKKIKKLGKKVGIDPTLTFFHYGHHTTDKVLANETTRKYFEQSDDYFLLHYVFKSKVLWQMYRLLCRMDEALPKWIDFFVSLKQRLSK